MSSPIHFNFSFKNANFSTRAILTSLLQGHIEFGRGRFFMSYKTWARLFTIMNPFFEYVSTDCVKRHEDTWELFGCKIIFDNDMNGIVYSPNEK
jgi:hypothetical protein